MTDDPRAADRERILAAARSWLGTPFHDGQCLKGVGVDCARFVGECFIESGLIKPFEVPYYSSLWFAHTSEPRLEDFVIKVGGKRIEEQAAQPGDLVLYKLAKAFAHAAIVVDWRDRETAQIIHAHKLNKRVLQMGAFDADLRGREVRFFSLWP